MTEHYELLSGSRHYTLKESSRGRYREAYDIQLNKWAAGESVHNTEFDFCCPDFSCCVPHLAWLPHIRLIFMTGTEEKREELLSCALREQIKSVTGYDPQMNPGDSNVY